MRRREFKAVQRHGPSPWEVTFIFGAEVAEGERSRDAADALSILARCCRIATPIVWPLQLLGDRGARNSRKWMPSKKQYFEQEYRQTKCVMVYRPVDHVE
jgi:hypothetical protein